MAQYLREVFGITSAPKREVERSQLRKCSSKSAKLLNQKNNFLISNQSVMSENQRTFAEGFIFKRSEKAPDFVIGRISIKVDEAIEFLKKNQKNGWVNLQAKTGRSGQPYLELDTYEPKGDGNASSRSQAKKVDDEELPF